MAQKKNYQRDGCACRRRKSAIMVAFPKLFAGLSGCAMLLLFSPSHVPSETLDIVSQTDSEMVIEIQPAPVGQSGWNAFAQLRGTHQISQKSQPQRVNVSCAVGVAVYLFSCCWIVAWAWGGAQIGLLVVHIAREVFDALLALTAFLPSLEARFAEIVAAILISVVGLVAIIGHLSCSPRLWGKSCKASLFILIGAGLALPHFSTEMRDLFPVQLFGMIAAILVHVVPTRALAADWSFYARHARRLWNTSSMYCRRWLLTCSRSLLRKCSCRRACGSDTIAHGRDRGVRKTGASTGRDGRERSCHHLAPISRRGAITAAWKEGVGTQKSYDNIHVIDKSAQKIAATQSAHIGGRRSPLVPAPPKRRNSGALPLAPPEARRDISSTGTRKENTPVEARRNSVSGHSQKENIPLETRRENIFFEAQKVRPNATVPNKGGLASQSVTRQSLPGLVSEPSGGKGATGYTSRFPIFVDEEFTDPVGIVASATSPEPIDILSATEGHQAVVDTLSARLASIRAFKTHWAAGNTSKALPELHSRDNQWAPRDIDKIRLLLENASPPTEQAQAASLCTMRVRVQTILASTHGI